MKKIFLFLAVFLIGLGVYAAEGENNFRLLVFGDSLSAGYGLSSEQAFYTQLGNALRARGFRNVAVINASRSGETASGGANRLESVLQQNPDAVLLALGINDAFRQRPVANIQADLEKIITEFQKNDIGVMLIGMHAPLQMNQTYQDEFSRMYADLARQHNLILYPFFMEGLFVAGNDSSASHSDSIYFLSDKIHPSAKGVELMVQNILPTVEKFLKGFR